jgi:hypothetical protein
MCQIAGFRTHEMLEVRAKQAHLKGSLICIQSLFNPP